MDASIAAGRLEVMDASGADALRFAMAYASTGSQDARWGDRRVEMGRAFANKLDRTFRGERSERGRRGGAQACR